MIFLIAALVLVGALSIFQLMLLLAVLRRLREHEARFERIAEGGALSGGYDPSVLVGRQVPELAHAASPGDAPRPVGFFSVGCDACHEQAPAFVASAATRGASAVVVGDTPEELVGLLDGVPAVTVGVRSEELAKAVDIQVFPTFLEVDGDGLIVWAGFEPAAVATTS
ncbi:hypothetical protein LHJ74_11970 [Streptomyces sp. N2-109]|uniref:Thioredoxin domain-containing protein n=1 Tax=Streptomyces gossypii TaxID=2883101 RepID=A0ABT2JRV4_9ACTN|nr:hypothetical protein [Streptomyces gossypii]MCT2590615.1 hypothetical protein [Streptomyces gossypii]